MRAHIFINKLCQIFNGKYRKRDEIITKNIYMKFKNAKFKN